MFCSALLSRMYTVVSPVQQFALYSNHTGSQESKCLNHVACRCLWETKNSELFSVSSHLVVPSRTPIFILLLLLLSPSPGFSPKSL